MLPAPWQVGHVLAIWKPLSITNVLVPAPPQLEQVLRFTPVFSPLPEQEVQLIKGFMITVRVVPFAASIKLTPILTAKSSPR